MRRPDLRSWPAGFDDRHDCAKKAAVTSICSHGARRIFLQIAWQEDAMIGVRFGAMCMIVLGGMLVSSAAEAAQACDKRLSRTCRPAATQINPAASNAQRAATATPRSITPTATVKRTSAPLNGKPAAAEAYAAIIPLASATCAMSLSRLGIVSIRELEH